MQYRLGELFCGPGGIGYAAITAEIKNVIGEMKQVFFSVIASN
jgi:hypothetical protein